jgi:hypothetical protein
MVSWASPFRHFRRHNIFSPNTIKAFRGGTTEFPTLAMEQ